MRVLTKNNMEVVMKKIMTIIIAAALAASLCACGSSQQQSASDGSETNTAVSGAEDNASGSEGSANTQVDMEAFESASAYIESLIDTKEMTSDTDDENEDSVYRYWMYDDILEGTTFSNEVEVAGNKIIIGETLENELEGMGFELSTPGDTVQPEEEASVTIIKDDKEAVVTLETNYEEEAVNIGDLLVYGFEGNVNDFSLPFTYSGLKEGSTMEEALEIFGNPNSDIYLSTDEFGTQITLTYYYETETDDMYLMNTLDITFSYNSGKTVLSGLNLSHDDYYTEWDLDDSYLETYIEE